MSQVYIEWHPRESSRVSCAQDRLDKLENLNKEIDNQKFVLSNKQRRYSKEDNLSYLMGQE